MRNGLEALMGLPLKATQDFNSSAVIGCSSLDIRPSYGRNRAKATIGNAEI
ncbi:hypothetical protein KAH81_07500 [bacterium]|nr:hypothetical protein [bacterium]